MTVKTSLDLLKIYCTILQQMQQKLRWQTHNYPFTTSKIFGKCLQSAFILWKYSVEYLHTCAPLYVCKGLSYISHCSHCIFISRPRGESGIKANTWPLKLVRVSLKEGKNHCYCIAIYKSSHLFLSHTDTHSSTTCIIFLLV